MLNSDDFKQSFRKRDKDFTRNRVLTFVGLVVSQINLMSKSLSVEVSRFVERVLGRDRDCSKQAFSQSRLKLKAEAFTALRRRLVSQFYADGDYKKWQGYLTLAIDGSILQLPESAALVEEFGLAENKGKSMPMARSSLLYDVENGLVLDALLKDYKTGEPEMALAHIAYLGELSATSPCLLLFDRGYPSLWLMACLQQQGLEFVIRCNAGFLTEVSEFARQAEPQALLEVDLERGRRLKNEKLLRFLKPGQTKMWVRCVKVELKGGAVEYLLTSLQEMEIATFQELYHKRWRVETAIDLHKNVLQLENFSAKTVLGVRQDFEAHILSVSLSALLIADAQEELESEQAQKQNRHRYKVNRAVAVGLVKDNLASLLMGKAPIEEVYDKLKEKIKKRKEAIKPGRSYNRAQKLHYKFHSNKRPVV